MLEDCTPYRMKELTMTDNNNIYGDDYTPKEPEKILSFDGSNDEGNEAYNASREGTCIMLEIKFSNGEGKFITYNMIQEMDYFMDNILSITTVSCIIEIKGSQLPILANRISRHEIEWIQEGKSNEDGVTINEIKIHTSADTLKADA